jgi:hypothetical protein
LVKQHGGKIVYRLIIAGIGVAAAASFAFGCGVGGGDEATAQVSSAQFVKQAEKLCPKIQEKRSDEVTAWIKSSPNGKTDDGFKEVVGPSLEKEAEELEAIGPPAKFDPLIENMAKVGEAVTREGEKGTRGPAMEAYRQASIRFHLINC